MVRVRARVRVVVGVARPTMLSILICVSVKQKTVGVAFSPG